MIILALGANLNSKYGTPIQSLQACGELLNKNNLTVISASSIWKSAPVPASGQPWYYNAVCHIETRYEPDRLLQIIAAIETEAGRTRHNRNESRTLDIDIIAYDNQKIEKDDLFIPHPRLQQRAFVLFPLQEIAPLWHHPVTNESLDDMISKLPEDQKIEKIKNALIMSSNQEHT